MGGRDLDCDRYAGRSRDPWFVLVVLAATSMAMSFGCVRRTISIDSEPQGALVYLNDQEIGRTPVSTDFTWYGDYDIILRHRGYETLKTHEWVHAPWYQLPPIDFVAEALWPGWIHDQRSFAYSLEPEVPPGREEVLKRAAALRLRAIAPADGQAEPDE